MNLQNIPVHATIPNGWSTYTFDCPAGANGGDCFKNNNNGNTVTIVDVTHHMHGTGRGMRTFSFFFFFRSFLCQSSLNNTNNNTGTRLYDASNTVYKELVTNYYDFNFQDYVRTESFQFKPDTYAKVECVFESQGESWGLGSENEMCMTFLLYVLTISLYSSLIRFSENTHTHTQQILPRELSRC